MKIFSENLTNLSELYINQLQTLLSAEQQITKALPKMVEEAVDEELRAAFEFHLKQTEVHVARLEQMLTELTGDAIPIKCKVMAALVAETEDLITDAVDESVRDAALIASAQRIEHYEMACYGAVRHFALILGEDDQAAVLNETLHEEGHTDHTLSAIALRVNPYAENVGL
jgi:ferritin-like metal-binding protein YciE